jgi:hypothetical protein
VWEVKIKLHIFLNSALFGDELSASCPSRFTSEENDSTVPIEIGRYVVSTVGLEGKARKKISAPARSHTTDFSYPGPV